MSAVASILSIILFLAFLTSGIQKVLFNPMASQSAGHLGFSKSAFQKIGMLEIAGGVAVMAGLAAKGTSFWAILNEVAAGGLTITMILAVYFHLREHDGFKVYAPAAGLGLVALLELIFRLA
ncbi:MAG: DoxX family protein [Acidimicrobiales bacterium]